MRSFNLARLVSSKIRRGKARSVATFLRPVRLHAERLEERMVMSANAPAAAIASSAAPSELQSAPTLIASATARWSDAAMTSAASQATQSPWDRFGSTEELRAWLIEAATAEWGDLFGQPTYSPDYYSWYCDDVITFNTTIDDLAIRAFTASDFNATVSTTNLQVDGVDEADLVETDGDFLYIVSGQDLVIVGVGEDDSLSVVSRVHLDERPVGMYLSGNRLAIVSSSDGDYFGARLGITPLFRVDAIDLTPVTGEFTVFDDIGPPARSGPTTTVTVLDITVRALPTLVQKTELDGRLISSRSVDGELRLVLSNDIQLPPPMAKLAGDPPQSDMEPPQFQPVDIDSTGDLLSIDVWRTAYFWGDYVYETKDEYIERVFDEILASFDARIRSLDADGAVISDAPLLEATSVYRPESHAQRTTTTVATFDMHSDQPGPVDTASVMTGAGAQVYATTNNIYLFAEKPAEMNEMGFIDWNAPRKSNVWKLAIDGATHSVELVAEGDFEGTLLNQFAVDERDGYLRVVTQPANWSGAGHGVVVLQEADNHLDVVGSITGIAAGESLYSVRIIGERVFFVTFVETIPIGDPLFVVDLSDPTNPTIMGELHIPGFSDYLEPIDETHLLAIGRNANGSGNMGELQVSIFDVSDSTNPQLTQRYAFDGGSTTLSPATGESRVRGDGDHHAVSYFADERILALPIYSAGSSNRWWWNASETPLFETGHGGLQVFSVDVDAGFTPIGLVEHDTLINRSVRIGERLFAISSGTVSAHDLLNPNTTLGSVEIGASNDLPPVELTMFIPTAGAAVEPIGGRIWGVEAMPFEIAQAAAYDEPLSVETTERESPAPLPQVGWVLPTLKSSRHTQPARVAAFSQHVPSRQIDHNLAVSLAAATVAELSSFDYLTGGNNLEAESDGQEHADRRLSEFFSDSVRVPGFNSL